MFEVIIDYENGFRQGYEAEETTLIFEKDMICVRQFGIDINISLPDVKTITIREI